MAGAQARRAKTERDGPASSVADSSHSTSQSRSAANSGRDSNPPPVGTRFDGNRDPTPPPPQSDYVPQYDENGVQVFSKAFKNVDMGAAAFDMVRGVSNDSLTQMRFTTNMTTAQG